MTVRRRWWGAAAAVCLAAGGPLGIAVGAPTGSPEAAYWWLPEPVSGFIPVPGVPPNGLYVAASPSGPQAESAVRFSVVDQIAYVRLTLHVSKQEHVGTPAVVGYPATSKWQTGGPQPWSSRPSYRNSAKPARGVFSEQGTKLTITFPAEEATTGIVLVPDPHAASSTFSVAFAPPTSADITLTPVPHPSTSTTHAQGTPSHHPTTHPTQHHSTGPGRTPSTSPTHRRTKPAKASPTAAATTPSASPTPSAPVRPAADDDDHAARDVIAISAIAVGLLFLFSWWRATRRE